MATARRSCSIHELASEAGTTMSLGSGETKQVVHPMQFRIRREIYADGRIIYALEKLYRFYDRYALIPNGERFQVIGTHGQLPFLKGVIRTALAKERARKKISDCVIHTESA